MTLLTPSFRLIIDYLKNYDYRVDSLFSDAALGNFVSISSPTHNGRLIINAKSPTYPFATTSARRIYKDKTLAHALVGGLDIVTPSTIVTDAYNDDLNEFLNTHGKVIVKPRSGQGGHGLTLNVTNQEQLKEAIDKAILHSSQALVQRQFIGEEVRFTTFNGQVKSAMLRQKPRVIGDGESTVSQLIERENEARSLLTFSAVQYPLLDETIVSVDVLQSQDVPALGEKIELGLGTMIRNGASMYEIIDSIDTSYIKIVEKIALFFGNGMIAIDMMISDTNAAATTDNYIFLEMNGDPALVLYYSCRDGKQFDIVNDHLGPMLINAIEEAVRL